MTDYEDYKAELVRWKQAVANDMTLLGFHTWLAHEARALKEMTEIEMADKAERRRPPLIDLGWANGWIETPEIVKNCTHQQTEVSLGSCVTQVSCPVCRFTYQVDSGDCGS